MEDKDLIVCHSFLSHNYLLTAINDEVAALIILAIFSSVYSVILVELVKLAKLGSEHDRDLANHHSCSVILRDHLFDLPLSLASLHVDLKLVPVKLLLGELDVNKQLGGIRQVAGTSFMRINCSVLIILLCDPGGRVHTCLAEFHLPDDEFVSIMLLFILEKSKVNA